MVLPVAALVAALVRWLVQGSHNPWTAGAKRFYIPDPDLGWQISPHTAIWIGLDVCAAIAAVAAALFIAGWWLRRREVRTGHRAKGLRAATWVVAIAPLAAPIVAFASGAAPAGAVDTLPLAQRQGIENGITGAIDAPAGRYEVVAHPATSVTAHLSAGHETFDARFGGEIRGSWQGDPHDLTAPVHAEISVDAKSVDTGIDLRSTHARDEYLHADKFPQITVAIDRVLAASQAGANTVKFRAHATLGLIGKTHEVEISGTIKKPDVAGLGRLNLSGSGDVLIVQADFDVVIKQTALASDASDFDGDRIPIHVSLVLRHTTG